MENSSGVPDGVLLTSQQMNLKVADLAAPCSKDTTTPAIPLQPRQSSAISYLDRSM